MPLLPPTKIASVQSSAGKTLAAKPPRTGRGFSWKVRDAESDI
jgi:hypothetical protein